MLQLRLQVEADGLHRSLEDHLLAALWLYDYAGTGLIDRLLPPEI